jgi:HAD superfamily hydrolase (TIGR01549 family)
VTLDLDDTLWSYPAVVPGMAAALQEFLTASAPALAADYDAQAVIHVLTAPREGRATARVYRDWLTEDGLRLQLAAAGEDPAIAAQALAVVREARLRVTLFADAEPAVGRLARAGLRVLAVTDGTADVRAIGIDGWFDAVVTAEEAGAPKPDARIFVRACEVARCSPAEVLHAGDDLVKDVGGALGAGLHAAWVHRGSGGQPPERALNVPDLLALADALGA